MKKSVKIILSTIIIIALGFGVFFRLEQIKQAEFDANPEGKPTVKIGSVFDLVNYQISIDISLALGEMLKKYKDGPINYIYIPEDSSGQATKGISAAKKLTYFDNVDIIISAITAVAQQVSPIATKENILHIAIALDAKLEDNPTSFTFWTTPDSVVKKYIEFLQAQNITETAAIVLNVATTETTYEALEKEAEKAGIKLTKYSLFPNTRDYRVEIQKLKSSNHQHVTFLIWPPEMDLIIKQYKDANIKLPYSSIMNFSNAKDLSFVDGIPFVDEAVVEDDTIIEDIKEKIGAKGTVAFAIGYDMLDIINDNIVKFYNENKRIPDGTELTKMITEMETYEGLVNRTISSGRRIQAEPALVKIINGRPTAIKE